MEIQFDKKLMDKVINAQFNTVSVNWFRTLYYYMTDSKFRTVKRLDSFIKEQLDNPDQELVELAESLRKKSPDDTVLNILKWTRDNITYMSDVKQFDKEEYWDKAIEVFHNRVSDCDGQHIFIYVLARLAGIPAFCLYNVIGDTPNGGHYWLCYYSTKHDKLVSIDSTYHPTIKPIKDREQFRLTETKYKSIWFIFSDIYIYKFRET